MINWKNSDSFYNNEHQGSGKPVLLFIHSDQLSCCNELDSLLENINNQDSILENYSLSGYLHLTLQRMIKNLLTIIYL